MLIAYKCVDLLAANLPQNSFPPEAAIHVNGTVLLFAVGVALLTGLLFGSSPAWQFSRPDVSALMQSSSTKLAGNVRGRNFHRMSLIAGQVASHYGHVGGLRERRFAPSSRSTMTPMGFDPDHLFYINTGEPREASPNWQHLQVTQESIRQSAESTPGVISASISDNWVPPFQGYVAKISFSGNPNPTNAQASLALISFNMFSTLRIPPSLRALLHAGRDSARLPCCLGQSRLCQAVRARRRCNWPIGAESWIETGYTGCCDHRKSGQLAADHRRGGRRAEQRP